MLTAAGNLKTKSASEKKRMKKFKKMYATTGGCNPEGITINGENPLDEINFTFKEDDSSSAVAAEFEKTLIKCYWWEEKNEPTS